MPTCKSHFASELNKLLNMWNSVGVKRRTVPHIINSNRSKPGRVPAVKSA